MSQSFQHNHVEIPCRAAYKKRKAWKETLHRGSASALIRTMGRIIFYEDRNFQGRSYETSSDCPELTSYLSRCHSCRVDSGIFVLYEKPNFTGLQVLVRRGEYPDSQRLMGPSAADCIQSCRMIPAVVFYEDRNFGGRSHEREDDASELHAYISRCNSIRVEGGFWVLYERPNYRGFQYVLGPGEYPDHQYWLGFSDAVRSCRLIRHVGASWRMKVWEEPNFEGESLELGENVPTFQEHWQNRPVHSCKVLEGAWVFYDQPNYRGCQYLLERGQYRRHSEWGGMQPSVGSIRRVNCP